MLDDTPKPNHSSYLDLVLQGLVGAGALQMNFDYGLDLLNRALSDIALLQIGIPFSELGISERRAACRPSLYAMDSNGDFQLVDAETATSQSDTPEGSVAVMRIRGMMQNEGGMSSRGIYDFADDMHKAYRNRNVGAIIVETDSGGGHSKAGDLAHEVISDRNKPVIARVLYAGSAAYNAIAPSDEIIGVKNAQFGSIGTFITLDMKMIGEYVARFKDVYAASSNNKNLEFRALLEGNLEPLKAMVEQKAGAFQETIRATRNLTGSQATQKETLSGAMFSSTEAKNRGLADSIGNFNHLMSRTKFWMKKGKK